MATLKCKMCGGDLELIQDMTIAECPYCGTKQTVPNADNEKKLTLFARANRLRFNNEFDKASGVYETIIGEFPEEAEAYWGLVLCKYGIEYVDDPATGKKIPTCHRSSFDSVMEEENLGLAMEYADAAAKKLYREEAKQIEELRKGILEVSSTEEPYDIFICYKETDEAGERTLDSVLAQDIYTALTEKGYRVFFSRITLEDKLGQEYEPYIFAALHSAKVMLAVGTAYEYYDAVWVKNEWSRFLQLIAAGEKKVLIPCYKNLDAYDMPKEFAKLQAQDMGKVGALQDLVRGVEKVLGEKKEKTESTGEAAAISGVSMLNAQAASFVKRGYIALEDGEFETAENFFEQALNHDAECGQAYLGKALVSRKTRNIEEFTESLIEELVGLDEEIEVYEMKAGEKYSDVDSFQFDINLTAAVRAADEATGFLSGLTDDELEDALTLEFGGPVIPFQYGYEPRFSKYEKDLRKCKTPKALGQMVECRDFERADQYADATVRRDIDAVWNSVVQRMKEGKAKEERFQAEWEEQKEKREKEKQKEYEDIIAGWLKDASEELANWKTMAEAERKADEEEAETAYQEALAEHEADYIKRLNEWKQEKEEYPERYREASARQAELRGKIAQLEQEREQLRGFFKGRKLRELEENIAVLQNSLNAVILPQEPGEAPIENDAPKREEFRSELLQKEKDRKLKIKIAVFPTYRRTNSSPQSLSKAVVGDSVEFGSYFYENHAEKQGIRWRVLKKQENAVLLLSEKAIDVKRYHEEWEDITWENCTLRKWLNQEFLEVAFNESEQAMIQTTAVDNSQSQGYSDYDTNGGNDTQDKIFLLSYKEAFADYFSSDRERLCQPTPYAENQGVYVNDEGNAYWWLRSPGIDQLSVACVSSSGDRNGNDVYCDDNGVRPALWVNLDSDIF